MTAVDTARSVVSHRALPRLELHRLVGEQERELRVLRRRAAAATEMEVQIDVQAQAIAGLRGRLEAAVRVEGDVHAKAGRCDEAEARAADAVQQLNDQTAELRELRAFKDRAMAVSVPPGHRDIDPDDQPTHPAGLDVRDLRARFAVGPVVSLWDSPQAADLAHIPRTMPVT